MILSTHGIVGSQILQIDPDYLAFVNRVTTAGGSLSTTEQSAVLQLVKDLKDYGIWTKMKAIYPMVGASQAACSQNLKSSSFTGTFTTGWTFASTGATPNGSSAYMNTGLNASGNLTTSNAHLSVYVNVLSGAGDRINGTYPGIFIDQFSGTSIYYGVGSENTASNAVNNLGLIQVNALSNLGIFRNGVNLQSVATGGTLPSRTLFLGASNKGSGGEYWWSGRMSFSSIGDGLTATEVSNFYTAVQAFQTTLSRQV
jgi:hypothetical protein